MIDQSNKKDYDGPLYAPWHKVVAGKRKFLEWLEKQNQKK